MSVSEVVPMYVGYAVGSIIKKEEILLPIKIQEMQLVQTQLNAVESQKQMLSPKDQQRQEKVCVYNFKINNFNKQLGDLTKEVERLIKKVSVAAIEEHLPLDIQSKMRTDKTAFQSERLKQIRFQMCSEKTNESFESDIKNDVQAFISDLFLEDANQNILPNGSLESLARAIQGICKSNFGAFLIGSFITLNRVRTIDPITLRKGAIISENLKKNAHDYYVLTEAVLGAVFLGVGQWQSESRETGMNNISMFHFISQGAIPKVSQTFQGCDLGAVYVDWKDKLADELTGYPIRFKFRKLADILEENHYSIDSSRPIHESLTHQSVSTIL